MQRRDVTNDVCIREQYVCWWIIEIWHRSATEAKKGPLPAHRLEPSPLSTQAWLTCLAAPEDRNEGAMASPPADHRWRPLFWQRTGFSDKEGPLGDRRYYNVETTRFDTS